MSEAEKLKDLTESKAAEVAKLEQLRGLTVDKLAEVYRGLRKKKEDIESRHKDVMAGYNNNLGTIENILQEKLDSVGAKSIATPHGTVYKRTLTSTSVKDFDATIEFIKANDYWHALERRVSKKAVTDYIEETGEDFPGVAVSSITKVQIRAN